MEKSLISQFKKGILELCVLGLINKKDFYGYELVEAISKSIDTAEGTIYPILRRLALEKLCETYLKESAEGPPRKYYRITKIGRSTFENSLKEWKEFNKNVNHILTKETGNV